ASRRQRGSSDAVISCSTWPPGVRSLPPSVARKATESVTSCLYAANLPRVDVNERSTPGPVSGPSQDRPPPSVPRRGTPGTRRSSSEMTATTTASPTIPTGPRAGAVRRARADRAWIVAVATAVGQVTGLLGAYALLVGVLLMARVPWLERFLGFDRLAVWHRWVGFTTVWPLVAHTVFITIGYAEANRESLAGQT